MAQPSTIILRDLDIFRSPSGQAFVYRDNPPGGDGDLLFADDGIHFRELGSAGFAGWTEQHELSFKDPVDGRVHELQRDGDRLYFDGQTFVRSPRISEQELCIAPLPAQRQPEYLFALRGPGGEPPVYIYCSDTVYNRSYKWWMFVGRLPVLRRVRIFNVLRASDGGTTTVETDAGVLHAPTPWRPERLATWNDQPLVQLSPASFHIEESPGHAVITPAAAPLV
jgi:hypothetical protein